MTKKEKEAEKKKLAAKLAKLDAGEDADEDGDEDEDEATDPKEEKILDLIAKGVDRAITKRVGRGKQPPKRDEKGILDSVAELFGVKE